MLRLNVVAPWRSKKIIGISKYKIVKTNFYHILISMKILVFSNIYDKLHSKHPIFLFQLTPRILMFEI